MSLSAPRHLIAEVDRTYLMDCVEDLDMHIALKRQFLNMLRVVAYYEDIPPESYTVLASVKKEC